MTRSTGGGRSVGIVRVRTEATDFFMPRSHVPVSTGRQVPIIAGQNSGAQ